MSNRIKQIDHKDEVTRVNEYHWYSPIRRAEREMTFWTTRETSAFLSHALWSSRLLDERRRWREPRSVSDSLIAPRSHCRGSTDDTFDEIYDLNLGMRKRYHLHPFACPSSAYRFPIQPDIFNIVVVSVLFAIPPPIFGATLKAPSSSGKTLDFFFPVKVNSRDFSLTLLLRLCLILIITCLTALNNLVILNNFAYLLGRKYICFNITRKTALIS